MQSWHVAVAHVHRPSLSRLHTGSKLQGLVHDTVTSTAACRGGIDRIARNLSTSRPSFGRVFFHACQELQSNLDCTNMVSRWKKLHNTSPCDQSDFSLSASLAAASPITASIGHQREKGICFLTCAYMTIIFLIMHALV